MDSARKTQPGKWAVCLGPLSVLGVILGGGCGGDDGHPPLEGQQNVFVNGHLGPGLDIGINTSEGQTRWVSLVGDGMRMRYPAGQCWGSVFITVGPLKDPPRPGQDYSAFDRLAVELRGEQGGESLELGVKDQTTPDDGREATVRVTGLTTEWQTAVVPLTLFQTSAFGTTTDLHWLYVVTEFLFIGPTAQTVDFRNVRFLRPADVASGDMLTVDPVTLPPAGQSDIYVGPCLGRWYRLGVDSSGRRHDWVTDLKGEMKMAYPPGQSWGAVFITVGPPVDPPCPFQDFSDFQTLSVGLRGERGGEKVSIGVKTHTDPDNGREPKFVVNNLTTDWQTFKIPLSELVREPGYPASRFQTLYVVCEFVFEPGTSAETVFFRNVRFE